MRFPSILTWVLYTLDGQIFEKVWILSFIYICIYIFFKLLWWYQSWAYIIGKIVTFTINKHIVDLDNNDFKHKRDFFFNKKYLYLRGYLDNWFICVRDRAPGPSFIKCWAKPTWMDGVVLLALKMEVQLVAFPPLRLRVLQWSRHLFNYWKNKKTIITFDCVL